MQYSARRERGQDGERAVAVDRLVLDEARVAALLRVGDDRRELAAGLVDLELDVPVVAVRVVQVVLQQRPGPRPRGVSLRGQDSKRDEG